MGLMQGHKHMPKYMIERTMPGAGRLTVVSRQSSAGQSLIVPAHRNHGFRNSGTGTLHIHAVLASAVFEAMPEGATEMVRRWGS